MRRLGVASWIVLMVVAATVLLGKAAQAGLLIWVALPFAVLVVVGLAVLRPKEELAGWSVFTVWLSTTYLSLGGIEWAGFAVVVVFALLGYFRSPWFLAAAWLLHIAWDFVPRELPELLVDLPVACLIFDGVIGLYLALGARAGRWSPPAQGSS